MRSCSVKCVFLLAGTFCFILCTVLYGQRSDVAPGSEQAAGGSVDAPADDQVDWRIISAAPREEEEESIEAPCSLRKAVRHDPLLRRRFRFSVPVFQWLGSFSKPAWEQLRNQAPPYGWKGLPVNVVKSALDLLNSSRLFDRGSPGRCVRCAVVGNGGILRGSRQGKNIDSHDFVFRMNGAVIGGFEEDVGTKVSFYGFTTNTMKNALSSYRTDGFTKIPQSPDIKYIFIPSDLRDYVMLAAAVRGLTVGSGRDKGDRPWKYFGHKPAESFRILHPDFLSYVTHSFLRSPLLTDVRTYHLYMPSTGALMLLTALHTCDQVSAYGFITRNYAAFSDHYYDSVRRPLRFFANHDLRMESRLWETLHLQRVIRLYQRRAGS
ncbi:alpha-N-acetylgalactosaminide alpha-2,6-sialyltransferase 2 isoform X2 [Xiphias gladius]|uniref:alpha-N-acetylgalactosaminide alpha-2,6-sialyltransferase 2 isoform X2 n=1 Tax=Xiphias gladius TaxID=8245 RepID=UPI001A9A0371|nr:alpha-N-acetylgalactosaminide alpha-2,6-sialyltransferase 2 isoform X2 [Xiphias gladius]